MQKWRGCNVTMPHKQAVMPLLDRLDPLAAKIGAVNTIVREADGTVTGYNTDAGGLPRAAAAAAWRSNIWFRMHTVLRNKRRGARQRPQRLEETPGIGVVTRNRAVGLADDCTSLHRFSRPAGQAGRATGSPPACVAWSRCSRAYFCTSLTRDSA